MGGGGVGGIKGVVVGVSLCLTLKEKNFCVVL